MRRAPVDRCLPVSTGCVTTPNHYGFFPCKFVPLDGYTEVTVTVTAPTGTVHEAFFDPAALGSGVVGRDAAQGVLAPAAVGAASGAAGAAGSSGTSATLRRLTWDAGQLRLDVAGTTLGRPAVGADPAGRHGGADAARRRGHAHRHRGRPRAALAGLFATLAAGPSA